MFKVYVLPLPVNTNKNIDKFLIQTGGLSSLGNLLKMLDALILSALYNDHVSSA